MEESFKLSSRQVEKLSMIVVFAAIFWEIQLNGQHAALLLLFFLCFLVELILYKTISHIYMGTEEEDIDEDVKKDIEATKNGIKVFAMVLFVAFMYNLFLVLISM